VRESKSEIGFLDFWKTQILQIGIGIRKSVFENAILKINFAGKIFQKCLKIFMDAQAALCNM